MRSLLNVYAVASLALVTLMVYDESARHGSFFPTTTALASNNLFHTALANAFFVTLYLWGRAVSRIFLGPLTSAERTRVTEKFFFIFIDTMLSVGIFRMHLHYWAVAQLSGVVAMRVLHQLAAARLESLEQALSVSWLKMARYASLLGLLFTADVLLSVFYTDVVLRDGFGLAILLAFEFVLMAVAASSTTVKLLLHNIEQYLGGQWEGRGGARFYTEIATEVVSGILYVCYATVAYQYAMAPLHIIRHLFENISRLSRAVRDCSNYRKLVAKLQRLGDPTEEQLAQDPQCSVCLGDIETPNGAKRLPCGHMFHRQCLCRWLERNNTCPYCRQELEPMIDRLENERRAQRQQQPPGAVNQRQPPGDAAGGGAAPHALRQAFGFRQGAPPPGRGPAPAGAAAGGGDVPAAIERAIDAQYAQYRLAFDRQQAVLRERERLRTQEEEKPQHANSTRAATPTPPPSHGANSPATGDDDHAHVCRAAVAEFHARVSKAQEEHRRAVASAESVLEKQLAAATVALQKAMTSTSSEKRSEPPAAGATASAGEALPATAAVEDAEANDVVATGHPPAAPAE